MICLGSSRCRHAGFTLLELLVGLAILSMLVVALYAGLRSAFAIADRGEERALRSENTRQVISFLQRVLSAGLPVLELDSGRRRVLLNAEARELTIGVDMPTRFRAGGIYEVELKPNADGQGLVFARRLFHPDIASNSGQIDVRRLLAEGQVRFRYFGRVSRRAEPQWYDAWQSKALFPSLVAIQVSGVDDADWPEIVVSWPIGRSRFQVRGRDAQSQSEQPESAGEGPGSPTGIAPDGASNE